MRRIKVRTAAFVFAIMFCIASCGGQNKETDAPRITIRLAAPQNAYIENFDTNFYKLWLEEQTGFRIEMTWLPAEDARRIVMLALSTGEGLPDAYVGFGTYDIFNSYNLQKYGESGVILPLNDLIEQYGVNLKAAWHDLADYELSQYMMSANGNFYYMPSFSSSLITRYIRQVMWVNKGWLDALGIQTPTTTDEFRDMLIAFKTKDPNGNGIADEIPMAGTEDHYGKQVYDYLFNAFIYNRPKNDRLLIENGIVGFAPARDEWREALTFMRGLYEDGLFSPLSFTQSNQQHIQMANEPQDILGAFTSPGITYTVLQNSPEVIERYVGIGPLTGPNGVRNAAVNVPLPNPQGVITSASQHPAEVFKLFDLMLSEEAYLIGRYGEKGADWDWAREGDISIYGNPAVIRIINQLWNTQQNKHLCQIVPHVSRSRLFNGVTWDGNKTDGEYMNAQAAMLYPPYEPKEFIREIIFTAAERERILNIRSDIDAYFKRCVIDFITGKRDINNDGEWDAYISELNRLGLGTLIDTAQAAADRMRH